MKVSDYVSRDRFMLTANGVGFALFIMFISWFVLTNYVDLGAISGDMPPKQLKHILVLTSFIMPLYLGFANGFPGITPIKLYILTPFSMVFSVLFGSLLGLYFGVEWWVGLILLPLSLLLVFATDVVRFTYVLAFLFIVQILRFMPNVVENWKLFVASVAVIYPAFLVWNLVFDRLAFDKKAEIPSIPESFCRLTAATTFVSLSIGLVFLVLVTPQYNDVHLFWINMTVLMLIMGANGHPVEMAKYRVLAVFCAAVVLIPLTAF
ncbi:MAG: hypothetical protein ABEK59_00770 [Halobacteria archaeon]